MHVPSDEGTHGEGDNNGGERECNDNEKKTTDFRPSGMTDCFEWIPSNLGFQDVYDNWDTKSQIKSVHSS